MVKSQSKELSWMEKWQQHLQTSPLPETEESILLRILVQALVIVGIIATDVAAQTYTSLWSIPLSIVGAIFAWRTRKKKNISVKFLLAIGMLIALFSFFGNLFSNLNDTRLVLAQLLIQVQVLHSFDLPRRKDLGYSMVIGLILIGVAGTISQTTIFGVFLLIFLVIALPVLVLDYRSRLGLVNIDTLFQEKYLLKKKVSSSQNWFYYSPLSPKNLTIFITIILTLGLIIFALMPRFPGYQLQTFPVSGPANYENQQFGDNRSILNPGYLNEGNQSSGGSGGKNLLEGPGLLDETYYYGFNTKINQNLRGELKPKVVMKVRSQAPGFWRVLGFDHYTGQGWEISREETIDFKRPRWSYRFVFPLPNLSASKQIVQTYTAIADLPNLIPILRYPKYIFFPSQELALDSQGGIRSPLGLVEGLTYTVVSDVPYRDRTLLGQAHEEYTPGVKKYYLQIPANIESRVRQETEALLAKSPKPLNSAYEKALFLTQAVKQNFTIQPELPFLEESEDLVTAFLFWYQGGYPDHFATALTIMLRSIGIPARLAVGFASGQFNPFTGYYIVKNTDAYALTEVYFPGYGWFQFDPIPGHEIIPPSFEENQTFSVIKQFWNWVASWIPSPISAIVADIWEGIITGLFTAINWFWQYVSSSVIGFLVGLIILIALSFISWLGINQMMYLFTYRRLVKLPPMQRLYLTMLQILQEQGYPKHPAQTPLEYATNMSKSVKYTKAKIIKDISQAYVNWRYGEAKIANLAYLQEQLNSLKKSQKKAN